MKALLTITINYIAMVVFLAPAHAAGCTNDAVQSGRICVDKYESSIWTIDPVEPKFTQSLRKLRRLANSGQATQAKLMAIPGILQVGVTTDGYDPDCPNEGAGCTNFFAVSARG